MNVVKCHYCKRKFTPKRTTAKFCSVKCRVAYSRVLDNTRKQARKQTYVVIDTLEDTVARYPELRAEVIDMLRECMQALAQAANKFSNSEKAKGVM